MSDNVRNLFAKDIDPNLSDTDFLAFILHHLKNEMQTQTLEINQNISELNKKIIELNKKVDYAFTTINPKSTTVKTKKSKKTEGPGMDYFMSNYPTNSDKFKALLDENDLNNLLNEFEDFLKDHDSDDLKIKEAEIIWQNIISKNDDLIQQINNMVEGKEEIKSVKKKTTKKKTENDENTEVKPKTTRKKSTKKKEDN
jgi:hypothetical protein